MSLTDKVIKNTYYHFLSQIINFVAPLFLTPFIISRIGNTEFGIYAFIIGVSGIFSLFDLSISSSFFKFISEYYNKKKYDELNSVINTASIFYFVFSIACILIALLLKDYFLAAINIPPEYNDKAVFTYIIALTAFSLVNTFGIFNSVIISLQKMYLTSLWGIILSALNFVSVITLLLMGFGLYGILSAHIFFITCSLMISMYYSFRLIPEIRVGLKYYSNKTLKSMFNIGAQMQVSKLSSFASDKYDEFLLAYFSVIGNVTFFNLAGRVSRVGKIIPIQLFTQVAPVAAELNAKGKSHLLQALFEDTTKYLTLATIPIFTYMILFAEELILVWIGPGYEISAHLLRIIAVGSIMNLLLSAPGNSITPNIGKPKFSMYEGLIFLSINIVLSYLLVKYYGIIGAAYGSTISTTIAALYVFIASAKFFEKKYSYIITHLFTKPVISAAVSSAICYPLYLLLVRVIKPEGRLDTSVIVIILFLVFTGSYALVIIFSKYLDKKEYRIFAKILLFFPPLKNYLIGRNNSQKEGYRRYNNELVSIFIVTYNRLDYLKKCITSLRPALNDVNYELIIWDNNSNDGTREYLKSIEEANIKIHLKEKNIGTNAKHYAVEKCKGDFIIGIDDDVIEFPAGWLKTMLEAYKNIPKMGYLSTDVIRDEKTNGAKPPEDNYFDIPYFGNKFILQSGPAGGWVFMISRDIYNKAGKFVVDPGKIFTAEDGNYTKRVIEQGYRVGILKGVKVYHATDIGNNEQYKEIYDNKMIEVHSAGKVNGFIKLKIFFSHSRYYFYKFLSLLEKEAYESRQGMVLDEN
jgi:O-antigen/teichoic acid export membrane protein/GT2 family glycosyltransferase